MKEKEKGERLIQNHMTQHAHKTFC